MLFLFFSFAFYFCFKDNCVFSYFSEDISDSSFPFFKKKNSASCMVSISSRLLFFYLFVYLLFCFDLCHSLIFDGAWSLWVGHQQADCEPWEKGFGLSSVVSSVGVFWLGCIFGKIPGISNFRSFLLCLPEALGDFQFSCLECLFLDACNLGTSGRSELDGQHSVHAPIFRVMRLS